LFPYKEQEQLKKEGREGKRNTMKKRKHVAMRARSMESMSVNDDFDGGQLGERSTLNLPQARELPGPRNPRGEFI
jgi:hypothetical protein